MNNTIDTSESSCSIRYSPSNSLHFEMPLDVSVPPKLRNIHQDFKRDWRAGWFRLAAERPPLNQNPLLQFWQEIASHFLTYLCHLPPESPCDSVPTPDSILIEKWILCAPPMIGGEYLSVEHIIALWQSLNEWFLQTLKEFEGIAQFLEVHAPHWKQVGRVFFHLAENKKDEGRPFAFLATYSTQLISDGKVKFLPLKEALNQYSGSNDRQGLVKLLTPVYQASQKCEWIQELLDKAEIYQALAWTPQQAYRFLAAIPQMEESGLTVKIPNWWKQRSRPQVSVTIGSALKSTLGASSLLDFQVRLAIGDTEISEEELSEILAKNQNLVYVRGQWIEVDRDRLQDALAHWKRVQKQHKNGQISFFDGMRLLAGVPSDDSGEDESEISQWVRVTTGKALSDILCQLRHPDRISSKQLKNVHAVLRPYQEEGVGWLTLLTGLGLGACLADDMGLGKTLQILSLLMLKRKQNASAKLPPSLLIVPASLLGNWQKEAFRFTPSLKLLFLHPSEIKGAESDFMEEKPEQYLNEVDLVITTYSMVSKIKWLTQLSWDILILDEAQSIKNSGTKQTKSVKELKSQSRIALTGTPIENRLSDLWSLFDFLNPGLLGSPKQFKDYVDFLQSHPSRYDSLRKLISPYILRRMKTDPKVISDLPDKIEVPIYCRLTTQQIQNYQMVVDELKSTLETVEPDRRRGVVLKTILQLKQICNHPCQYSGVGKYDPSYSGKFERLQEICEELVSRQEKVLLFTQFSEIIPELKEFLEQIFGREGLILHGGTPIKERKRLVEEFQTSDGPPFFILSLKAGGTGLTLTEASHVIHFDRWWNPAVENQATDRAFRIGQKKNVMVHKFITQGTIEEKIDAMIASKQNLASEILASTDEVKITELSDQDLLNLISLDLTKIVSN